MAAWWTWVWVGGAACLFVRGTIVEGMGGTHPDVGWAAEGDADGAADGRDELEELVALVLGTMRVGCSSH